MRALLWILLAVPAVAAEAPEWVRQAAAMQAPAYPAKVTAVVLLHEEHLTVDSEGRRLMRERGAVRLLQTRRQSVAAYRTYNAKSGRIRDFRAWLVHPQSGAVAFGKDRVLDMALSAGDTYSELRAKILECSPDAPAGSVFAYEIVEQEDTVFTQYQHRLQDDAPVLIARFVLSIPAGWEAVGTIFNGRQIEPEVSAGTYTWEMRGLPPIEEEQYMPDTNSLVPRLALAYYPSGPNDARLPVFKDWRSVSTWLSGFTDPAAEVTAPITSKAAELTRDKTSETDKIRAIARFVQQTNYISVQMNITRGGGYTPNRAEQVLAHNYGDCKDKATLMRALLRAAGIESYIAVTDAQDRLYVRPEWPSPLQFNHAIVAVRVPAAVSLPAVVDCSLGRLLLFDPTDASTPVGGFPEAQQGSHALVIAGDRGELVRAPRLPASDSRVEHLVTAELAAEGRISANISARYFGQSAASTRALVAANDGEQLRRIVENSLQARLGGIALSKVTPVEHPEDNRVDLEIVFAAGNFAQLMQNRLLVMKPGTLGSIRGFHFTAGQRQSPVLLPARVHNDEVVLKLPPGFQVDELPAAVKVETAYGSYTASWTARPGQVVFRQMLEVKQTLAPPSDYEKIREFFAQVAGSEYAAVVLLRR